MTLSLLPDATLILGPDATREQWLDARKHGIGASEAAAVAGLSPFIGHTPADIWADKVLPNYGTRPVTDAMRWGTLLEPVIADWYAEHTGYTLTPVGLLAHRDRPWQIATPDRHIAGTSELVEIKTSEGYGFDDGIPEHVHLQAMHQMAVTGAAAVHVVALIARSRTVVIRLERDEHLIDELTALCSKFWHDNVLTKRMPETSSADAAVLAALYPGSEGEVSIELDAATIAAADELAILKADRKDLDELIAERENLIKAAMGNATIATAAGTRVATWKQVTTRAIDMTALKTQHSELVESFRAPRISRTFRLS